MTFADLLTLIGSYAFPIVMCIAFFWRQYKSDEEHREEMTHMRESHAAEMQLMRESHAAESAKFTEALNNNTLALQRLTDKLED